MRRGNDKCSELKGLTAAAGALAAEALVGEGGHQGENDPKDGDRSTNQVRWRVSVAAINTKSVARGESPRGWSDERPSEDESYVPANAHASVNCSADWGKGDKPLSFYFSSATAEL